MHIQLPIDSLLAAGPAAAGGETIGRSRGGRELVGYRLGRGPRRVSLIAGCHADEPVGPAMLERLAAGLGRLAPEDPLLTELAWAIVPHANPDGAAVNATWSAASLPPGDSLPAAASLPDLDLAQYVCHAVREAPGDDVEFGFPRSAEDTAARPENRAIAAFLRPGAPYVLHASWHGMAFAAGPWFLMEAAWAQRTGEMREHLRRRVRSLGYRPHDIDRGGDKGFARIDEGFTTRPDSRAMVAHFEAAGDPATAALFRPSSMEFVRSLGGDPLTLVSEMPLFLLPAECWQAEDLICPPAVRELAAAAAGGDPEHIRNTGERLGVRPMPIADQMRLQLEFLQAGLRAACGVGTSRE